MDYEKGRVKYDIWIKTKIKHFLKILFIYLFLEREDGWEKERKRNINVWLPLTCPPTGDLAHNPGMCPDRELN